jgi:putative ABC transport system permease protein
LVRLVGWPCTKYAHNVRPPPRRSTLTVTTLGLGLGAVLLFGMLAWSFEKTLVARLLRSERSDMVIFCAFVSGGYRTAPLAGDLLAELRTIPGVALAVGEQAKDIPYGEGTVVLMACDAACFLDRRIYEWPLESGALPDALIRVARGDAVLLTTSFARQYAVRPGNVIVLSAPTGPLELTVAGISSGAPESAVLMSRDLYRTSWNDTTIWTAKLALDAGASYAQVEQAIAAKLGTKYRLTIRSSPELIEYFAGEVRQAFSLQYLLEAITLLLVLIAIGDTLASGVFERSRELGMMRAIGLRRSRLFTIVMLEGATIAVLGLAVSTCTGLALGIFWVTTQFPALVGWDLDRTSPTGLRPRHSPSPFACARWARFCLRSAPRVGRRSKRSATIECEVRPTWP